MGKLIYNLNVSLDGFVETVDHSLDWSVVDDELHSWFNERSRSLDAELYGRRIYELMAAYVADGRVQSRGDRAGARVRPDLERDAEDRLLDDPGVGQAGLPAGGGRRGRSPGRASF